MNFLKQKCHRISALIKLLAVHPLSLRQSPFLLLDSVAGLWDWVFPQPHLLLQTHPLFSWRNTPQSYVHMNKHTHIVLFHSFFSLLCPYMNSICCYHLRVFLHLTQTHCSVVTFQPMYTQLQSQDLQYLMSYLSNYLQQKFETIWYFTYQTWPKESYKCGLLGFQPRTLNKQVYVWGHFESWRPNSRWWQPQWWPKGKFSRRIFFLNEIWIAVHFKTIMC